MNIPLLQFFAHSALIATFLGPILLIWRLRLRVGLPCGILWFWLGLMVWGYFANAVEIENHRLCYPRCHRDPDDDIIGFFIVLFWGFPLSLIYCVLLSLLTGALKATLHTLKEIKANNRPE
jgi:hypothetical protein